MSFSIFLYSHCVLYASCASSPNSAMQIAAKIQGKAKPQEILIGEDVYNRIHPSLQKEFSKKMWEDGEWKYHSRETGELYPVYYHSN